MPKKWRTCTAESILSGTSDTGGLLQRVLRCANAAPRRLLWSCVAAMALPGLWTAAAAACGTLGVNPLDIVIRAPGQWSLTLLLLALAIAPLRHGLLMLAQQGNARYGKRLPDWNWLIRLRRPIGLASFAYACLHLAAYVGFDIGLDWHEFASDLYSKPFVGAGCAGFVLLLPLAVTSTNGWMRRLGRRWKQLHWLVYPAASLALLHFVLLSKPGVADPLPYLAVATVLLGYRLLAHRLHPSQPAPAGEHIDGAAPERPDTATCGALPDAARQLPVSRFPHAPRS